MSVCREGVRPEQVWGRGCTCGSWAIVLGCGVDVALTCAGESGVEEQQVTPCEQPKCRLNNAYHKPLEHALHNKVNVPPTVDRSPNMK